jgi:hypothetical protein
MAIGMDTEDIGNITTTGTYLFRPDPLRSHTNVARSSGNHLNTMFKRPGKPLGRFFFCLRIADCQPKTTRSYIAGRRLNYEREPLFWALRRKS